MGDTSGKPGTGCLGPFAKREQGRREGRDPSQTPNPQALARSISLERSGLSSLQGIQEELPLLLASLEGASAIFLLGALEGNLEILRAAGRSLSGFAEEEPGRFLVWRRWIRECGNGELLRVIREEPTRARVARRACPPLFSDELLWRRGFRAGFELFWPQADHAIRRFARRFRNGEAEEWIQFCAVQLFLDLGRGRYRPQRGSFLRWLHVWLCFRWKDWWRRKAAEPRREPFPQAPWGGAVRLDTSEGEGVERLLQRIPWPDCREAILESSLGGERRASVSRRLGITRGELVNRIRRGRSFLRQRGYRSTWMRSL